MAHLENVGRRGPERTENISLKSENLLRWDRLEPWLSVMFAALVLILWQWLSTTGRISALFFPAPSTILMTLWKMILKGTLYPNLEATVTRLFTGFFIGGAIGLLLGLGMGWSQRLRTIVDPLIAALHPIPKIAIFPLIMIIFGIVGYILRKFRYEPAPLVLAFILGPMLENAFRQSLIISDGRFSIFLEKPISATALMISAFLFVSTGFSYHWKIKTKIELEE